MFRQLHTDHGTTDQFGLGIESPISRLLLATVPHLMNSYIVYKAFPFVSVTIA